MVMRKRHVSLYAVLGAAVIGGAFLPAAHAESLNDALASAYQYNPEIDAERARLRATDENVARAMSGFRPRVDTQADLTYQKLNTRPDSTAEGSLNQKNYSVTATQDVFSGFRTVNAVKGSEAGVRAGREQLRFTEQRVLLDAVTAYMDTVRDKEIVRLLESNVAALTKELKATKDRFAVGEVTRTDVAQSEARRAGAISDLDLSQANLKSSRARFEQVVGHPPGNLSEPANSGSGMPNSLADAVGIAMKESPSIIAALYTEEQARYSVDEIRGELLPEVTLQANYTDSLDPSKFLDEQERASVTGRVTMPLYEGGETYARVRQAKHTHVGRLQDIQQRRDEATAEVTSAWSQLEATRAQLASDKVQVESNQIALDGVREEERVGQRTLIDVLNQQLEVVSAQVQQVRTRRNLVVNRYTLMRSIGRLEMSQLGLTPSVYDPAVHADEVRRQWFGLSITHDDGTVEDVDVSGDHLPAK